jgi:hypothetical protein
MTAKEKAVELYNKYEQLGKDFTRGVSMAEFAKQCALIAVDEVIKAIPDASDYDSSYNHELVYWQLVKEEIEKL